MKKLLLIDDDPFTFKMFEDFFRKEWRIINDTVTEQILERMKSDRPDVVLLNAALRRTDGEPVFDAIHGEHPEIPIIVYAPANQMKLGRALRDKGAFWHLSMPINTDDVQHIMNMAMMLDAARKGTESIHRDFLRVEAGISRVSEPMQDSLPPHFTFDKDDLIQSAVELLADILQVEIASLMILDQEKGQMRIKAAKGLSQYVIDNTVKNLGDGITGWVAREGKPLLIKDVDQAKEFSESPFYHQYSTKSLVSVPLKAGSRIVGVLSANNKMSGEPFHEHDLYMATIFSHLILLMLHSAQMHFDKTRMMAQESKMGQLSRRMNATLDAKVLFESLLTETTAIFDVEYGFLFLLSEKMNTCTVYYKDHGRFAEINLAEEKLRQWLSQRHESQFILAASKEPEIKMLEEIVQKKIGSWLSVPIVMKDKMTGSIEVASSEPRKLHDSDKAALMRVSQQATLAINNARLYSKLLDSLKEVSEARKEVERVRRGNYL